MVSTLIWKFRTISRRLWVRAFLLAALALLTAILAPLLAPAVPESFAKGIDREAVRGLLDILTNSMLAVTTFSLSIMVTAHLSADKGVTPRSHRILQEDTRTQTVLATFTGSFIYALFQILLINSGIVGEASYPIVYVFTILVIGIVVIALLRWIAHLAGLGSVEETARRVEEEAKEAIDLYRRAPFLGGTPMLDFDETVPDDAHVIHALDHGFVQHIDTAAVSSVIEEKNGRAILSRLPGDWVSAGEILAYVSTATFDDETEEAVRNAITIGDVRRSDQDPGHALIVLAEIAERALSPGINDPRTAMDIVSRLLRLCSNLLARSGPPEIEAPRVMVAPLNVSRLLEDAFDRIARDGRTFVEVQMQVQAAYRSLAEHPDNKVVEGARILSRRALTYAEDGLLLAEDLARVRALALVDGAAPITEIQSRRLYGEDAPDEPMEVQREGGAATS